jgi:hypothetical protein
MKKYLRWIVGAVPLLAGLFQIIDYIPTLAAYFATNNSFNVYYRGTLVDNGGGRTVMICIDDTTRLHNLKILFPTFKNTTKHTANDLSLTYSLEMTNIGLEPKDLFSLMYDGDNNYTLKYKENKLSAYDSTTVPVRKFSILDRIATMRLKAFATCDGIEKPFNYNVNAVLFYLPSQDRQYKEWTKSCREVIIEKTESRKFDILYSSRKFGDEYVDDIVRDGMESFGVIKSQDPTIYRLSKNIERGRIGITNIKSLNNKKEGDSLIIRITNYLKDTCLVATMTTIDESTQEVRKQKDSVYLTYGYNQIEMQLEKGKEFVNYTIDEKEEKTDKTINKEVKLSLKKPIIGFLLILIGLFFLFLLRKRNITVKCSQSV